MSVQPTSSPNQQPPGWYDVGQGWARYWDGQSWSEAVTHEALAAQQAAQQAPAAPAPQPGPAYAEPAPSYQAPAQPGYQDPQPGYPQPGYGQPEYAQPGYPQPGYQPAGQEVPGPPGYQAPGQPAYQAQPGYQDPGQGAYQVPGQPPGYQPSAPSAQPGASVVDNLTGVVGGLPPWALPAVIGAGCLLVIVGSFLPWARVDAGFATISVSGTDGDGVLTLILAIGGAAAAGVAATGRRLAAIGGIVGGGISFLIGAYDLIDLARAVDVEGFATAHVGIGLLLVVFGALVATVASVAHLVLSPKAPAATAPRPTW